jgi:hypothetical protein
MEVVREDVNLEDQHRKLTQPCRTARPSPGLGREERQGQRTSIRSCPT